MRNYTIAFLLAFLYSPVFCQDHYAEKLQEQFSNTENDTARMTIAAELGIYFYGNRNQDSSLHYFQVAENIGKQLQYTNTDIYEKLLLYFNHQDTIRVLTMAKICNLYSFTNSDSALFYGQKALDLSRQIKYPKGEANALLDLALSIYNMGDYPRSMELCLKALQISEKHNFIFLKATAFDHIGNIYLDMKEYSKSIEYYHQSMEFCREVNNNYLYNIGQSNLLESYLGLNQLDSALYYGHLALEYGRKYDSDIIPWTLYSLGKVYLQQGNRQLALKYLKDGLENSYKQNNTKLAAAISLSLGKLFKQNSQLDSSLYYAKQGLANAMEGNYYNEIIGAGNFFSELYESTDTKKALHYSRIVIAAEKDLYNLGKKYALKSITDFDQKERDYEIEAETTAYKNKVKQYALLTGLGVFLLVAFILFRNNRQKQNANRVLSKTLSDLKSTQAQLIQSEKMASLGELTAGIAHEIQNPLNFVNNFSEVNKELLAEMNEEIEKGNFEEVKFLAKDVSDNEEKINHHGKRADAIVKGMLQHSRSSSATKEPTDINKLADEYLRLAYHGLRAKDKTFNATLKTDYDDSIGHLNIVPQDIGRVILNLITNAFYVINEKKIQQPNEYEPTISISTEKINNIVELTVKDNGNGIPQKVVDKIFQPFFTTKPTGEGTGLGLSLSYDIVKAHGGEIRVETKEGEGTQFIIQLPV
jgi:two-component system, NtrC family, sensor kinase